MGPKTDEHDFQFKARHVRRFMEDGNKAKVTIRFRGREMVHTELGRRLLDRMTQDLLDIATIESHPQAGGAEPWSMILTPKQRSGLGGSDERQDAMPKMKTKRSAAKRIRATGTGKLVRAKGWKQHLLEWKPSKRKRQLRKDALIPGG